MSKYETSLQGAVPVVPGNLISEARSYNGIQGRLGLVCLGLLAALLYAGLTPFRSPANQVAWITGGNALRFGEYGTMLSSGSLARPPLSRNQRTIEIWIQPGKATDSNTLLAFYDPASPRGLSLCQAESDLEIRIQSFNAWHSVRRDRINIADVFNDRRSIFWAITFGKAGTKVYRDGVLVRSSPLSPSPGELSGRIVVGNSPVFNDSWSGVLRGIAIYDSALTAEQISRHYVTWAKAAAPLIVPNEACIALYLFDEHSGFVAHNKVLRGIDLYIPRRYLVLQQTVLDPVWRSFNWSRGFWKDALINIVGFVPFGCFACAYLHALGFRRSVLLASLTGGAISLFIELAQTQLPTRDSSMSDVINNIIGCVTGSLAYRGMLRERLMRICQWKWVS